MPRKSAQPSIPLSSRLNHLLRKDDFVLQAHWIEQEGATVCVGIEVWKDVTPEPDRHSVTPLPGARVRGFESTDLRTIPLATVLDQLWRMQQQSEAAYNAHLEEHAANLAIPKDANFDKPRRVNPTDKAFFQQVADVYLEAMRSPGRKKPTDAVARRFGVSASAATKWVRIAREDFKLLPGTTSGKPSAPASKNPRRAK